jgi:hypothetical protein
MAIRSGQSWQTMGTVLDDLSKSARTHEKTFSKKKSAVWVNHRNWNTLEVPVIKQVSKMHMQVYSGLSPKKPFKKPNLGESQMKAVFQATLLLLCFKISCATSPAREK